MTIKRHAALLCGFFFLLFLSAALPGAEVPPLRGRVNDYAQIIAPDRAASLERLLTQFDQETGHQMAILTIPTLAGDDIEGFGIRVADTWKIGKKGFDNGVILIVAPRDRKLRLEVGYGLEGVLPDATASRIIRDFIVPRFRAQDYSGGIIAGTEAVLKVIRREPLPAPARKTDQNGAAVPPVVLFAILFALFGVIAAFFSMTRRRSDIWGTHGRRYSPMGWGGGGTSGSW